MSIPLRDSLAVANVIRAVDRLLEVAAQRRKVKATSKLEKRLAVALRKAFRKQEREFLARFAKLKDEFAAVEVWRAALRSNVIMSPTVFRQMQEAAEPDWESLFEDAGIVSLAAFEGPLEAYIQMAISAGATEVLAVLGIDTAFDLANPKAVAYAKEQAAKVITQINTETKKQINQLVSEAVENGTSYSKLASQIKDKYSQFHTPVPQQHIPDRATLIAITEVGQAYEAGNETVVRDLQDGGLEIEKSWLTTQDERVSDGCRENQDAGWIPFDDPFPSGDMRPLRFPGCRCAALYRRKPSG